MCRHSDEKVSQAGRWNQKATTAQGRSYSEAVNPEDVSTVCGWGEGSVSGVTHYCPPQGALIPPKSVRAFIFPSVLKCVDGEVLNIIQAIEYVKQRQVCPISIDVRPSCAVAPMLRV
jgi:hypothetical protein